jgi:hypothetical protein
MVHGAFATRVHGAFATRVHGAFATMRALRALRAYSVSQEIA